MMNLYCPSCKGYQLEAKELEPGLVVGSCHKCQGNLIPLMNYRYWLQSQGDLDTSIDINIVAENDAQAKICPKCSRLMGKFNIDTESANRLDLCTSCDEAWLDAGEWELLKKLGLHIKLARIFTEEWQRTLRQQQKQNSIRNRYQNILGEDDFSRVVEFKQWLDVHDNKEFIKQYLIVNFG